MSATDASIFIAAHRFDAWVEIWALETDTNAKKYLRIGGRLVTVTSVADLKTEMTDQLTTRKITTFVSRSTFQPSSPFSHSALHPTALQPFTISTSTFQLFSLSACQSYIGGKRKKRNKNLNMRGETYLHVGGKHNTHGTKQLRRAALTLELHIY